MKKILHKIPWPDIPNAYVLLSFHEADHDKFEGVKVIQTFFYDNGTVGTEWEPVYGPIQLWETPEKGYEEKVQEHYFYPSVKHKPLNWSQLAVRDNRMQEELKAGNMKYIFGILKYWSER